MRVLVLSSVFPNSKQPTLGVFVRERMRRVAQHCHLTIVAPLPWFPLNGLIRGPLWSGIPHFERQDELPVYHPRFLCVPRYGKCLDGLLYAASLVPFLIRVRGTVRFDLIDAHFAFPDGVAAAVLGKLFGCPVVVTLRGSIVRLAGYRLHRPQLRWALTAAARILAVSESLKEVAVGLGIPAGKVRVIPNGVDSGRFYPRDRVQAREALGLPLDRTILLSVGGLNEGKGHHRIVRVLPRLLGRHPDLLYVIVGGERPSDTVRRLLEGLVERHGLRRHVRIIGERPHSEMPLWLAAADLFCLATRSEGWANVLLESLACGVPVVTTRAGGNPEIVTQESLGILVPPGDDGALAAGMLEGLGRTWDRDVLVRHAHRHSWDTVAAQVVEEFRGVVAGARPGRGAVASAPSRATAERR